MEFKDMSRLEQKDFTFEVKKISDDGSFTGYASVFNVEDDGADIVLPGAFTATLADLKAKNRTLPMLWAHDSRMPIGGYSDLREDNTGLWCEGKFTAGVVKADETRALMKAGVINGLSIGFQTKQYEIDQTDPNKYKRKLKELKLYEISVVTFPMLDSARVNDVKSVFDLSERELEQLFREGGLSRSDAVRAVSIVQKRAQRDAELKHQREADGAESLRDAAALSDLLNTIRETRKVTSA